MKSRTMFQLAIKIVGFIVLLQGIRNCVESLMILMGNAHPQSTTPQYWAGWAVIKIVGGVYLMVGITPFVNLAFPPKPDATSNVTEPTPTADGSDAVGENGRFLDPKAIFGLIVKTVGLIVLLFGLQYIVDALLHAMQGPQSRESSYQMWGVFGAVESFVGLAMLRGMVPLVDFAFPGDTTKGQVKFEEDLPQDERGGG
jgi:hypothetical protein